ncbi:MAG: hypothetical protein AAF125_03680 [Chloroflexota bacterium]
MDVTKSKAERINAHTAPIWAGFYRGVAVLPWIWLACFGVFLLIAAREVGHIPTYGNPDPKDLTRGGLLYVLAWLLLFPVLISPLLAGWAMATERLLARRVQWWPLWAAVYLTGYGYFLWVMTGPFGEWLLD